MRLRPVASSSSATDSGSQLGAAGDQVGQVGEHHLFLSPSETSSMAMSATSAGTEILVPQAVAHAEEDAHPDQRPAPRLVLAGAVAAVGDLAPLARSGEVAAIGVGEAQIMLAIDVVGDELRLLDDPVELGMPAGEGDERLEPDPLGGEPVRSALDRLGDMGAGRPAHVEDEGPEHLLLALEIGVEGAERDSGPAGDPGDRRLVEAALAELGRGGLDQAAKGLAAALGARLLVAIGRCRCHSLSPAEKLNRFSALRKRMAPIVILNLVQDPARRPRGGSSLDAETSSA